MWRRILMGVLLGLLLALVPATVISAGYPTVTITVSAWIVGYPNGFTVTYVSEYEVYLEWEKGEDAVNTMVRACIGREPADRTDGYIVYYGEGTEATDWVNMEVLSEPIYYKAWSENAEGKWESEGSAPGSVEGITMITIAFISLAVGLVGVAIWKKHILLYLAAFIGCLLIAVHLWGISAAMGVPVALLSCYMLWESVWWWF